MKNHALLLLIVLSSATLSTVYAQYQYNDQAVGGSSGDADAITIKLNPGVKRKKGDARAVVERLRNLPELQGASLAAASRDLLVLIPGPKQSGNQLREVLLQQPDVYELEAGEQLFRRPGDKPYDQLRKERLAEVLSQTKTKIKDQIKAKLQSLLKSKPKKGTSKGAGDGAAGSGGEAAEGPRGKKGAGKAKRARAIQKAIKRAARRAQREAAKGQNGGEEL